MFSLKFLAAAAALFITAQGAPANGLEERKLINDCGDSTFVDETSDASPLISDCEIIVSNIQNGGSWTTGDGGYWRQLVQFGTCALGVQGDFQAQVFYVGNEDIMNLITDSIKRFGRDGKVGAKGNMPCQGTTGVVSALSINWGLYHT